MDQAGATTALDGRPSSLALDAAGRVGVGFARGPVALQVGDLLLARPAVADEAGYAIAVADLDGDGVAEWLLGAPGAAGVYVVSEAGGALSVSRTLAGDGRFGQALALADVDGDGAVDLLVGAPGAGDTAAGAAVLYAGPDLTEADRWEGDRDGAQLGFAVAMAPGTALIGAPGGAGDVGRVTVARSPSPER